MYAKIDSTFIIDPGFVASYGLGKGRRMYRTGDLAQHNDGKYTNLVRWDVQVKIRGQKVELREVE
ncbi:hypothetical protein H9L39_17801 [Fusarium oxysporum f. sp. albedinis]|nr:hypothetical protein H9L39_17801 [Fusarium oxysporum f. sp. albedinis]